MADQSKTGGGGFKGYIPVAAALFIGVIVGGFLFAGEDVGEAIEQRVAATEAEFADQLGAARGEMDEQLTALSQRAEEIGQEIGRLDPIEQGQEALRAAGEEIGQRIETLEASMGERFGTHETRFAEHDERLTAQEEAGERVEALESRLQTMAEQMARLVTRLQEVESSGSAVAALGAPATGAGAAPAASGEPAAQERREQPQQQQQEPAQEQEQEQEQPQARQAQQSQAQPQTETFRLGFGEVGELAGVRVFVSRLDEAAGEIGLLTPGRGAQTVSESAPLDLGDGCSVRLDGFEDGLAVLSRRCETTQADAASTGAGGRQAQLTIGESVTLGGHQLALVRTDSEIGMAAVRVDDRRTVRIVPEWPASLGTDCSVRLVEVSEDAATLAATGDCGGEAQEESAAQQQPAAAQTAAAPEPEAQPQTQAAQDESPADTISAPTAAVQPEGQSQTAAETAAEAVQPAVAAARAGAQPAEAVTPPAPAEAEAGAEQAAVEPEAGATPAAAPAGGGDETLGESIELRSGETATIGGHSVELLRVEAESEYIAVRVDERRTVRVTPFWPASLERNCVVRLVEMTEDAATLQVQGDCAG